MNSIEVSELTRCEDIIKKGMTTFIEVGMALVTIRDQRLYRDEFATFEQYCGKRWSISRPRAYQLIEAAETVGRLSTTVDILPSTERQARPLASIPAGEQSQVWQAAVDSAPDGVVTAAHVQAVVDEHKAAFNYKRDNKKSTEQDIYTPQGMDACQTPGYAIDPILPYITQFNTIWEPAEGERLLVEALLDCTPHRFNVIGSDILSGKNFFDFEPEKWDCIVTNPPYSIKFLWLARCYTLGKPFALLMPVETLGSKTAQELFDRYGMDVILLDKRVNFKMPIKGWDSGGAQFPTAWFTWQLGLPSQIVYGKISHE
jgi:hypothetical protein